MEAYDAVAADFDGEQEYTKQITVSPVSGGFIVRFNDMNPNYELYTGRDGQVYDRSKHVQYVSRTRIFTDPKTMVEWLNTRLIKE